MRGDLGMANRSWGRNETWQRVAKPTKKERADLSKRLEAELKAARTAPEGGVKVERNVKALRRQQLETELKTVKVVGDHEGHRFASYTEMAEHWGINSHTLLDRLATGMSLEEALTSSLKHVGASRRHAEKKLETGKAELVGGAIVEQLTPKYIPDGINGTVANEVLTKTGGHSFRSSYETFKTFCENHRIGDGIYLVRYNQVDCIGNIFKDSKGFATYYNLLISEVRRVCKLKGSSGQGDHKRQSLSLALKPVGNSLQGQYSFGGKLFRNFDCACTWAKHDPNKVRLRMAQGEELEDILKEPDPEILKRDVIRYGDYAWVFMDKSKVLRFFGVTEQEVQEAMQVEIRPGVYRTREEAEHVMASRKAKGFAEIEDENRRKRVEKSRDTKKKQKEVKEAVEKSRSGTAEEEETQRIIVTRGDELVVAVGVDEDEAKKTVRSLVNSQKSDGAEEDEEIEPEEAVESIGDILKRTRLVREAEKLGVGKQEPEKEVTGPQTTIIKRRQLRRDRDEKADPLAPKKPTKQDKKAAAMEEKAKKKQEREERAAKEQEWLEAEARRLEAEAKEGKFKPYFMSGDGED